MSNEVQRQYNDCQTVALVCTDTMYFQYRCMVDAMFWREKGVTDQCLHWRVRRESDRERFVFSVSWCEDAAAEELSQIYTTELYI